MSDTPPVFLQAAAYLESQEQDILFRWVQVATGLPAHLRRPHEDLKTLLDSMPVILAHVRRQIQEPVDRDSPAAIPEESTVGHALTRYRQRVSAHTIIKEYQLLRQQIWVTWQRWPEASSLSSVDSYLLAERLDFALDEFIALTLATFVELTAEGTSGGAAERGDHPGRR